ncbi:hypothetical protein QBC45DRAFT_165696 [Copromyces sp. CBS 386.78]|nr:hypothetical protein QBC45DRAFT_165696 [Copromyces sp. CBS 386.78]
MAGGGVEWGGFGRSFAGRAGFAGFSGRERERAHCPGRPWSARPLAPVTTAGQWPLHCLNAGAPHNPTRGDSNSRPPEVKAKLPTWRPRQCQPAPIRAISSCKVRIGVQSYRGAPQIQRFYFDTCFCSFSFLLSEPNGFWWNDDASKHLLVVMGSSN